MAGELEGSKSLSGLLSGLAQDAFHGHPGITEELLHSQLYPEVPLEEFRPFLAKMRGILKSIASADMDFNQLEAFLTAQTKKQGGITCEQAAVISKFWKSHKTRIRESLVNQSRWDNGLRGLSWRVDGKSQSRHSAQIDTPVAIIELEFGKSGQESEFLCLEFDEVKVKQTLKRLSEVEESISTLMQAA
ncbi:COMM domain-containing protein 1 isoform X1 [Cricetulus griseus]|uniref:COMM domain-containing protein 1 n=1 Tax=Cricetulus griseus TaxID=10029 RepID=G3HDR1_CRIGR|nr:COMM domain-containing protein 1 isoform X1 [Cricetulus griseus]XP_027243829.1 COMM domain-containing protein 1 isoform X1 [Cricetulus griseus]EGW00368.1 COMM domain-containing protein 1 [Cricetulus griseus]